ncbi:palmitoyltransferase akr1 [Elasticomyces elasticus]|nr:palmitoyltransferase akr1 [Elasticomyces elasticus]
MDMPPATADPASHDEPEHVETDRPGGPKPSLPVEDDLMQLARLGEIRSIQKLFDSGRYKATYADDEGITPLHWAAINGHLALCHFLIQAGSNVNAKGGEAEATPVLWAAKKCHLQVIDLLLKNGADPLITDDQGYNLLHAATLDGNVFQLILLLHHSDISVDIPDGQGHTSLMWAAYIGFPACLDVLLRWGADVHAKDDLGFTALHWAIVKGSQACIHKLVEYGADRFAKNNEGKTPSITAREMNSSRQWHKALSDCGYDKDGNPKDFPFSFITQDTRKFTRRFFFFWPFPLIFSSLYILSFVIVYAAIPLALVTAYGFQWSGQQLLRWAPSDMKHIHKTPFLAGFFAGTLFWVGVRWINTWLEAPFFNLLFAICYGLCAYFYFLTMLEDPGYVPKGGSRNQQRTVIEDLLSSGHFNEQYFCTICMIRKPLRSKHCGRCKRCIAREDHHCPWVDNCIGVNNHRHFVLYTIFLVGGILTLVRLQLIYLSVLPRPPTSALHCKILNEALCAEFHKDPFTLVTSIWAAFQLTWVTMLLFVQLTQIARNMTTYESMRGTAHPGPITSALTTGSISAEGGQIAAPPGHAHNHKHNKRQEGCWAQWKKLLGLDSFIATALHGSRAAEVQARRRQNPFTRGCVVNCKDFWLDERPVFAKGRESGAARLGGQRVDYARLFEVPGAMDYVAVAGGEV